MSKSDSNDNNLSWTTRIRLTQSDGKQLEEQFKATTFRHFSEFLRAVLSQRPFKIKTRSQSVDDFLSIALDIKKNTLSIQAEFIKAVKILEELKAAGLFSDKIEYYQAAQFSTEQRIEDIHKILTKIYHHVCKGESTR